MTPRWVWVLAALAVGFVAIPLLGMFGMVDWHHAGSLLTTPASRAALRLSLITAIASTALCVVLGVPLAVGLANARGRLRAVVRTIVLIPLVLPPVVSGMALLTTFGRQGLIGRELQLLGVRIAFTTTAVVLAQTFVAMPFLVLSTEGALRTIGRRPADVAASLGASPTTALRRVTLPLIAPALVTGTLLSFARSLGEFGATLTFAGSLQGVTRTLPLEVYLQREVDPAAAVALSTLLVGIAALVVLLTRVRTP